jgi:hypothetical protein
VLMIPAGFEPAPPERPGPYPGALDQLGQSTQFLREKLCKCYSSDGRVLSKGSFSARLLVNNSLVQRLRDACRQVHTVALEPYMVARNTTDLQFLALSRCRLVTHYVHQV